VLLPYLSAYWYVDQLRKPSRSGAGIEMSLTADKFVGGKRLFVPIIDRIDTAIGLKDMLEFVGSEDSRTKVGLSDGQMSNYVPAHKLCLNVDKSLIDKVPAEDSVYINLKEQYLRMDRLVLLDIIATNNWELPVYFASYQEPMEIGLDKYLRLDGYAYKLTPYKSNPTDPSDVGFVETDALYDKYMHRFDFKTLSDPKVYLDWTHVSTVNILSLRGKFAQLADALLKEGKTEKAVKVLDRITAMLPNERIPFDYQTSKIAEMYLRAGATSKGETLLKQLKTATFENLDYFKTLPQNYLAGISYDLRINLYIMQEIIQIAQKYGVGDVTNEVSQYWNSLEGTLLPYVQR
jgi:hypothetical protein